MSTTNRPRPLAEEGFALIVLIVAIFVILLVLGVAAPKVARDLRRDRELESIQRANQYVRAIQLYYRKYQRYPTTVEQLEKTNNIRFLRKRYDDPLTGKPDYRLILVGQNKTTVKGLFGQPLAGLATTGIGGSGLGGSGTGATTAPGSATGTSPSGFGASASGSSGFGSTAGSTTAGSATTTGSSTGLGPGATTGDTSSTNNGIGSNSATDFKGASGPFMGVGTSKTGDSVVTVNEKNDYDSWEFLYDPRIELLKAKTSIFGGGAAAASIGGASSIGGSSTNGAGTLGSFGAPTGSSASPTSPTSAPPTAPLTPGNGP